ncbi:MAG: 30S ribosomal protein S20 [Candidatus Methylomirabilales bacterium]
MANSRSAEKRLRQAQQRTLRNRAAKSQLRTSMKKVRLAVETGNQEAAMAAFRAAVVLIDKTASKGIIHSRTAARYKSRLAHRLQASENAA